jgi:integrase/recombinase XerD
MVNRVAKDAGLAQSVTPQTLRHTFAFERARNGATEDDLIELLGLADDPRNRESVRRYLALAEPPL